MARPTFEVFKARDGGFRWRLRGGNGRVMAQSEGHTTKGNAVRAARAVRLAAAYCSNEVRDGHPRR